MVVDLGPWSQWGGVFVALPSSDLGELKGLVAAQAALVAHGGYDGSARWATNPVKVVGGFSGERKRAHVVT